MHIHEVWINWGIIILQILRSQDSSRMCTLISMWHSVLSKSHRLQRFCVNVLEGIIPDCVCPLLLFQLLFDSREASGFNLPFGEQVLLCDLTLSCVHEICFVLHALTHILACQSHKETKMHTDTHTHKGFEHGRILVYSLKDEEKHHRAVKNLHTDLHAQKHIDVNRRNAPRILFLNVQIWHIKCSDWYVVLDFFLLSDHTEAWANCVRL